MSYTAVESDIPPGDATYQQSDRQQARQSQDTVPVHINPDEWNWSQKLKESSHPIALLFYMFFRIFPILMYIFGNIFLGLIAKSNKFILHFIILILLLSADFWNLKNIAGRLLVGLRWWNESNPIEGAERNFENVWVFETADPNRYINPIDSRVFWTLLYIQPVSWIFLGIMALLKLEFLYLILILIAITLSVTNALAFTKCDKFAKANNIASDIFSKTTGSIFNRINPFS